MEGRVDKRSYKEECIITQFQVRKPIVTEARNGALEWPNRHTHECLNIEGLAWTKVFYEV